MNDMEFNRNTFNEIVGGGIPLNAILRDSNQVAEQFGGEKRTFESVFDGLVVPIGLDSHSGKGCIFAQPEKKTYEPTVILEELFDSLLDRVAQKKQHKSSQRKTVKKITKGNQ
jgi:hypothetical protein